jgi:hypothetical protein
MWIRWIRIRWIRIRIRSTTLFIMRYPRSGRRFEIFPCEAKIATLHKNFLLFSNVHYGVQPAHVETSKLVGIAEFLNSFYSPRQIL